MSELTQTNDSAASGTSEVSELLDVNDNFERIFHDSIKESTFLENIYLLGSSKNEESQTRQLTRKIRRTSGGGVVEHSRKVNGRTKSDKPYQMKRRTSRRLLTQTDSTTEKQNEWNNRFENSPDFPSVNEDQAKSGFTANHSSQIHSSVTAKWTRADSSPDSGLDYTGSSPSAVGYLHCSSGFGSEIDTSDLGTPNSYDFFFPKVKTTQYTTKKLRTYLQKNYIKIKEELDPEGLADILYSRDLIRESDREKITELRFRERKSDCLIKSLVLKSLKTTEEREDKFVDQVLKSFLDAKYGYVMKGFAKFTEPSHAEEIPVNCDWKPKLKYFFSTKGHEIDTLELIDKLLEGEVLAFEEHTLILNATTKDDKLECLSESVLKKSRRHYDIFCNLMKAEYPNTSKMLFDESVCEKMDTAERCNSPKLEIKVLKEFKFDDGETQVKLFIDNVDGPDHELEEMIVDQNSPKPSENLVEMVTEDAHCSCKISFSCIKISLENYSERALMILIEKCKSSPRFLERWIKELIDEDKMKKLKERNIKEVKFKVQVRWPDIVLRKQDIARNYGYLKDILEPKDYIGIFKEGNETQEVIKVIASSEPKEERAKKLLTYLVTSNDQELLEKFSAQLKTTKLILDMVKENRSEFIKRCTCKLTKNIIVETFSFLEEKVENIDEIIDIFANCSHFSKSVKERFESMKMKETSTFKMGAFLRQILDLPDDGIQVCLFQYALIQTQQNDLLKEILKKVSPQNVSTLITKDDISRNMSFLKQELEPMRFATMLEHNPDLKETILEIQSRKQRCEVFLDYLRECVTRVESFSSELQELQLTYITDYLVSSRFQGDAEKKITKEDISNNMCFLDDMIDPLELRHLLIGNEKDKSRTALTTVLSTSKKRRCKVFLEVMINSEDSIFNKFSSYLENEKPTVVRFLLNAREIEELKIRTNIESLLDAYTCIIAEVEPTRLEEMFTEKQVINRSDFKLICSKPTRKGRAIALMEAVLNGPPSRAQCLIEALDSSGYKSLVKEIQHFQDVFKPCQRLRRLDFGSQKTIVFEGVVNIKFDESTQGKSDSENISPSSSSRIYVSEASTVDSPLADSGCEFPSVHTPGSGRASRYTHASSGYTSESECGTPGTTYVIQTPKSPPDFISSEKKMSTPQNLQSLRKFIVNHFCDLKEEIDPVVLIDTLYNDTVLSSKLVEKLKYEKLRAAKCDFLFKAISKSISRDEDRQILCKVIKAFEIAGYGYVFKTFGKETGILKHVSPLKMEGMKQSISHNPYLEDEIEPLIIIDELVSKRIISLKEHQEIKDVESRKARYQLLKDKMLRTGEQAISAFSSSLELHYPHLDEQLKEEASGNYIGCKKMALRGKLVEEEKFKLLYKDFIPIFCKGSDILVTLQFYAQGKEHRMHIRNINENFEDKALENGLQIVQIIPTKSSGGVQLCLKSLSNLSEIDFLARCRESHAFLEDWIPFIFTDRHIENLRDNHIDEISVQIRIRLHDTEHVSCSCMLTKEAIVQHYSSLERNLENVDDIIKKFSRFNGFNESTKFSFMRLLYSLPGSKTEEFLRKLLDLSHTRIHLCLLENEMNRTNPLLLKQVTDVQVHTGMKLTVDDIESHMSFLSNELEPRHFIEMLDGLDESEHIVEKVVSNEPRRKRCRMLIDFIRKEKICDRFTQELERRNKTHLVEFITARRQIQDGANIKYALVQNYNRIINEIEPLLFQHIFIERCEISPIDYELILKLPSRRQRAQQLMRYILKGNEPIGKSFLDALDIAGYIHLLNAINTDIESHKKCPRLYQSLHGDLQGYMIKRKFNLEFSNGSNGLTKYTTHLSHGSKQDQTKRSVEETTSLQEAEIKRQRTHDWVHIHCGQTSKELT